MDEAQKTPTPYGIRKIKISHPIAGVLEIGDVWTDANGNHFFKRKQAEAILGRWEDAPTHGDTVRKVIATAEHGYHLALYCDGEITVDTWPIDPLGTRMFPLATLPLDDVKVSIVPTDAEALDRIALVINAAPENGTWRMGVRGILAEVGR